jgi:hypothetical protein
MAPTLAKKMLTIVNPDMRLVHPQGIDKPYRERLGHASGDLSSVQPGDFDSLCGWLRDARHGAAAEDQGHHTQPHVLVDAGHLVRLHGDAGLLKDFPPHRVARVLVQLDDSAGKDPFPVVGPLDGEHPAVRADDRGSGADRMTR